MCDRGVQQLREDEILDLIDKMRADYPHVHEARNHTPAEFLSLLEARTGLLVEARKSRHLGMDMPVYEFRHVTFQEYLAARALVDGRFPERNSERRLAEQVAPLAGRTENAAFIGTVEDYVDVVENWREALRLCTAICSDDDVDDVLRAIRTPLEGESETKRRARAILATLCIADEPNVSEETVQEVFQAFAGQVKNEDGSGYVRTNVDRAAMEIARTRWAGQLCSSLAEEFSRRDSKNRMRPGSLCAMVGGSRAPKNPRELDTWLSEQGDRLLSANEYEAIETALTISYLVFRNNIRGNAHFMSEPGLPDALLSRLNDSAPMAHAAAWALGWLNGGPRITEGKNWRPEPEHIEQILTFIGKSDSDPGAMRHLTFIMQNEKIEDAVGLFLAKLENPNVEIRAAAASALGGIGSECAIEPLISKLDDSEAEVRAAAALALGDIGSECAIEPLIAKFDDSEAEVRSDVAEALGRIGSERTVELLIAKLDDPHYEVRLNVAFALGNIKSESAVEPLIAKLNCPDTPLTVEIDVAVALGGIGSERAVEPLISKLNATDAFVRKVVATTLGRIGSERAVEPLISKLDDSDTDVRAAVTRSLGSIGSERAVNLLQARLDHPDAELRREALDALSLDFQETDRLLLSQDLERFYPLLDPHQEISTEFADQAADELGLTVEEVRARYEAMAERLHLRLAWCN